MQIKRFEAQNMTEALRAIKSELGPEAVILSARSISREGSGLGLLKRQGVEVTAATDVSSPRDRRKQGEGKERPFGERVEPGEIREQNPGPVLIRGGRNLQRYSRKGRKEEVGGQPSPRKGKADAAYSRDPSLFSGLNRHMLAQGVQEEVVSRLTEELRKLFLRQKGVPEKREGSGLLKKALSGIGLELSPIQTSGRKQNLVALVGPTGVGKTTTLAKLAAVYALEKKLDVGLISLDSYRIAAVEQLRVYAEIIGVPLEIASDNKDLKNAIRKLKGCSLVLIDTEGISQHNDKKLSRLRETFDKVKGLEVHLLLSANTKEEEQEEILKKFRSVPLSKLLFTKLDESRKHGSIINLLSQAGMPVSYFTYGQRVPEDIEPASLERLAELMTGGNVGEELGREDLYTPRASSVPRGGRGGQGHEFYVANKNSDVFHTSTCKWAKRIKGENIIMFEDISEALERDFKPCRLCARDIGRDHEIHLEAVAD